MLKYLQIVAFLFVTPSFAVNLYVDGSTGDNGNSGVTIQDAWETIDYAMETASPGDTILIVGGNYKENIKVYSKGGTNGSPIIVKNYDEHEVIIDGSLTASGWSVYSGNIYQTTIADSVDYKVDAVVVDYVALKPAITQTNANAGYTDTTTISEVTITEGQFYQDNSTNILYVWVPDGGTPSVHDLGIVRVTPDTSNQYDGVYLWDCSYFSFENLTIRFSGARGISSGTSSHNTFTNLKIKFNRHTGILTGSYAQLSNSEIAWNFLWNWPRGKFNGGTQGGGWGAGANVDNDSLAEGNEIYKNGGEGILTYMNSGNTIMRGNTVYDNWSMNMYVDTAENVVVERNMVYCTGVDDGDKENNAFPSDGSVYKGQHPIAIGTAEEFYGGNKLYYMRDVDIRNNIMVNCRRGYSHFAQATGSGMVRVRIVNNTIVVPDYSVPGVVTEGDGDNFVGIWPNNSQEANDANDIKNNIVVVGHSRNYALYNRDDEVDTFVTYGLSNNLYYNSGYVNPIHWGVAPNTALYDHTLSELQSLSGTTHGEGSLSVDPLFVGGADIYDSTYYALSEASQAIGAGVSISGYTDDFNGGTRSGDWSIGAVQKHIPTPQIKSITQQP